MISSCSICENEIILSLIAKNGSWRAEREGGEAPLVYISNIPRAMGRHNKPGASQGQGQVC